MAGMGGSKCLSSQAMCVRCLHLHVGYCCWCCSRVSPLPMGLHPRLSGNTRMISSCSFLTASRVFFFEYLMLPIFSTCLKSTFPLRHPVWGSGTSTICMLGPLFLCIAHASPRSSSCCHLRRSLQPRPHCRLCRALLASPPAVSQGYGTPWGVALVPSLSGVWYRSPLSRWGDISCWSRCPRPCCGHPTPLTRMGIGGGSYTVTDVTVFGITSCPSVCL